MTQGESLLWHACRRYILWLQSGICPPEALVLRANIHKNAKCYLQAMLKPLPPSIS
jgi:hypothetical protein